MKAKGFEAGGLVESFCVEHRVFDGFAEVCDVLKLEFGSSHATLKGSSLRGHSVTDETEGEF